MTFPSVILWGASSGDDIFDLGTLHQGHSKFIFASFEDRWVDKIRHIWPMWFQTHWRKQFWNRQRNRGVITTNDLHLPQVVTTLLWTGAMKGSTTYLEGLRLVILWLMFRCLKNCLFMCNMYFCRVLGIHAEMCTVVHSNRSTSFWTFHLVHCLCLSNQEQHNVWDWFSVSFQQNKNICHDSCRPFIIF